MAEERHESGVRQCVSIVVLRGITSQTMSVVTCHMKGLTRRSVSRSSSCVFVIFFSVITVNSTVAFRRRGRGVAGTPSTLVHD
jgi:hypothetical protein